MGLDAASFRNAELEPRIRLFSSEHLTDPTSYTVSYCLYAEWDGAKDTREWVRDSGAIDELYAAGYIPFSNFSDSTLPRNLFYKARSLRVDLSSLRIHPPRRRLDNYFERRLGLSFVGPVTLESLAARDDWESFRTSIPEWARFMPSSRLGYVLSRSYLNTAYAAFYPSGALAAVTLVVETKQLTHIWFDFYDKTCPELRKKNLHTWLHSRAILDAQAKGKSYLYLGSLYGEGARYKIHGLTGWSLSLGNRWISDAELDGEMFAMLMKRDAHRDTGVQLDMFKTSPTWDPAIARLPLITS